MHPSPRLTSLFVFTIWQNATCNQKQSTNLFDWMKERDKYHVKIIIINVNAKREQELGHILLLF